MSLYVLEFDPRSGEPRGAWGPFRDGESLPGSFYANPERVPEAEHTLRQKHPDVSWTEWIPQLEARSPYVSWWVVKDYPSDPSPETVLAEMRRDYARSLAQ